MAFGFQIQGTFEGSSKDFVSPQGAKGSGTLSAKFTVSQQGPMYRTDKGDLSLVHKHDWTLVKVPLLGYDAPTPRRVNPNEPKGMQRIFHGNWQVGFKH